MRTRTSIFRSLAVLLAVSGWGYAQAQIPSGNEGINYQAIARDGVGDVMVSTALTVTVDIKTGDPIPVSEYTETHAVVTNAYGQFSLVMGEGTPTLGTYAAIAWDAAKHWYGISIFDGVITVVLPDVAFQAVPYAHESSPHSLDEAYDVDGSGAGRTIIVDAVAVTLEVDGGNDGMLIIPQIDGLGTPLDAGLAVEDGVLGTLATGVLVEYNDGSSGDAFLADIGAGSTGKGLKIDQDGTGDAIEVNNSDGIGLEINNSGNDGSVVVAQTLVTNASDAVQIDNAGTGDAVEINNTDGIGMEINNSGNDGSVIVAQTLVANPADAVQIDNAGAGDAVEINNTDGIGLEVNNSGNDGSVVIAQTLVTNAADALQVDNAGTGNAVEINNTDGIGLEINNSGNDGSVVIAQSLVANAADAVMIANVGSGDAVEITNTDGIGMEINNSGDDISLKVDQTSPLSPATAAIIDNAGVAPALAVAQLNALAAAPAMVLDNAGMADGLKLTQTGAGTAIDIDNLGGAIGISVDNSFAPVGGIGMTVFSPTGDGVVVTTGHTVSAIGKVLGGGADATAGSFLTIPHLLGPPFATEPTLEAVNMVDGFAAVFTNTAASSFPTVAIGNFGTGNALTITSDDHTAHALSVESEAGFHTEGAAKFFNTHALTSADNVVEISTASTGFAGHTALEVFVPAITDQAANFEGKVDIAGDLLAGGAVTVTVGDLDVTAGSVTVGDDVIVGDFLSAVDGFFTGDLTILGTLAKTAGTFKIDHPQDPENKYLFHSFVESPDMMNIYNGNVSTDDKGFAIVELPGYFDVLNIDFRYQLTVIGSFAQAIIKEEVNENTFVIQTNEPNTKVSWMVTGVRNDDYARENRVKVEVEKEAEAKGTRLYTPIHP